jgi:tape measure domain-containing protein
LANVGYATLTVSPSMRGMQQSMQRQLGGMMPAAGRQAGRQLGQAIGAGATQPTLDGLRQAQAAAAQAVSRASGQLTAARAAEAASAARVSAAEGRLEQVRARKNATTAQVRSAEQALAAERIRHQGAIGQVASAQAALTAAQRQSTQATQQLRQAQAAATTTAVQGARQTTGAWQRVSGAVRAASTQVAASAASAGRAISTQVTGGARSASSAVGGIGSTFKSMAAMAGVALAAIGMAGFIGQIKEVASGAQNTEAVLDGLYTTAGHGAQESQRMTALLNKEFGRSQIAMTAFQQGARDLAWLGLNARKSTDLMKFLESSIVATGGGSEDVSRVTSALQTMQNQGKATMNEINMISQSGIPIFDLMTDHLGVTNDEFATMIRNGEIMVDDVLAGIEAQGGQWADGLIDGAENVNKTWSGAWASIKNTVINGLAQQVVPLLDKMAPRTVALGNKIEAAFGKLPGVISRVKSAMDRHGITDALRNIMSAAEDLARGAAPLLSGFATGIGVAFGIIIRVLEPVFRVLGAIGRWMQEHQGVVKAFAIVLGTLVTAFVALKAAIAIGAALAGLVSPIGLVIVGIAALGAAIYAAWQNSETFRSAVISGWERIQSAWTELWEGFLQPGLVALRDLWNEIWPQIQEVGLEAMSAVRQGAAELWQAVQPHLEEMLDWAREQWPEFKARAAAAFQSLRDWWDENGDDVLAKITDFGKKVRAFLLSMAAWWSEHGDTVMRVVRFFWDLVVQRIGGWLRTIYGIVQIFGGLIAGDWSQVWRGIRNVAEGIFKQIDAMAFGLLSGILNFLRRVVAAVRGVRNGILGVFRNAGRLLYTVGRNIIVGLMNGVTSRAGDLYSRMRSIASNALKSAKNALGISSPSKLFRDEVGAEIGRGLIEGIEGQQSAIDRRIGRMVNVPASPEVRRHAAAQAGGAGGAGGGVQIDTINMQPDESPERLAERLLFLQRARGM